MPVERIPVVPVLAALFVAACGTDSPSSTGDSGVASGGASSGAGSGASGSGVTADSGSGSGTGGSAGSSGTAGSPDAASASGSSGSVSSGSSSCPTAQPMDGKACTGSTVCEYGHATCCGIASSFMTCKCQPGGFSCYQTVECNFICPGSADASSDADASGRASDTGAGDGAPGTQCGAAAECMAGLLCCYPCGVAGCHNQCMAPVQGRCPMIP
ncbi:MAG TPA: hypothetical protein VGY54_02665 [Polyangiaceae bacterium]|nr:hypothetical protein [Polyangiaceae bacterium]